MKRVHLTRGAALVATTGAIALTVATPGLAAAATTGDVQVVNTETVQVYMDASGRVDTKRVYEQLALTGKGSVDLTNPISTSGLRNLDGFSSVEAKDGQQVVKTTVDGEKKLRSVSTFTGQLPLDVNISYELDGKTVKPGDVVGESGHLVVTFDVENVTGEPTQITYDDGKGGTVTTTEEVPIPIVGSLSTVAPSGFTNVTSQQANIAGDGKGGTKLSFTMTLFPPIGSTTASFGYEADVVDGVVPRVDISALPVNPLESPTFASAAKSYQGGADTGAQLTDGAVQIDTNLLRLRDGAAELLAGLIQLRDGAGELSEGLNDTAVPGAEKLAAGAGELSAGLGDLSDGAGKLSAGSDKLAGGTGDAYAGGQKLTAGLEQISGGLGQLSGQLPGATEGITKLQAGVDKLIAGLGAADQPTTILGGLAALSTGLGQLKAGSDQVTGGLQQLTASTGLPTAKGGVDAVKAGLEGSLTKLDELVATMNTLKAVCAGNVNCIAIADGVIAGVNGATGSRASTQAAVAGLGQVSTGLANAIGALSTQLIPGVQTVAGGLASAQGAVDTKLVPGAQQVKGGLGEVRTGLDQLSEGLTAAVAGVLKLDAGAGSAYSGSGDLTAGLGQLDAGANELSDGAGQLAAGATKAADGGSQVSDGAGQLADGLGDAGDGSELLFGGLQTAADGAPALVDGAQRLSTEGSQKLIEAGESTTDNYGAMVGAIKAGSERAQADDMAYGAPEGATGLTAYSYIIQGEDGEGSRNVARAVGGAAVLGAAGGVFFLRRRFLL